MRVSERGRKIRNANHMPKSDDRTESNLRRGRREEGGREDGRKTRRRRGGEVGRGEVGEGRWGEGRRGEGRRGGVFDLNNQGLGFASGRKKPCYRKSNSS